MTDRQSNFSHLVTLSPELAKLGSRAEQYFKDDPNTSLLKSRQFGELLAQETAARLGKYKVEAEQTQLELIQTLSRLGVPREVTDLFHVIRKLGNRANHQFADDLRLALQALKFAAQLGLWFQRTFGREGIQAKAFVIPEAPMVIPEEVQMELAKLREHKAQLDAQLTAVQSEASAASLRAEALAEEAQLWATLASEEEASKQQLQAKLAELQVQGVADISYSKQFLQRAFAAAKLVEMDESATRVLIDGQLAAAGWQVDTVNLRYSKGARPEAGQYKAIAEWPTKNGPADYALFHGLELLGLVEAKRQSRNVSGDIDQAKRYACGVTATDCKLPGGPWGEFNVPFVFSSNGRPYLKQLEHLSGIWFCDLRQASNLRRALDGWYSPEGLWELFKQDIPRAETELGQMPFEFGFDLRGYQRKAIEAVEESLREGKRYCLLAMATGTGKTKTCIALIYRLLKTRRFRRVLFLVDRAALGEQAANSFKDTRVDTLQTFADAFSIKEIDEALADPETCVHIATVQGMVARILGNEPSKVPPVDAYDCVIIDECHRGYLLDRELSETEFSFRDQQDYISKYRKVVEHFDAVRIGMTATPALHTSEIFGHPVYFYSYREAVLDGVLVDYDPPLVIKTELSENGIHWKAGEKVQVYCPDTQEIELFDTPDELSFEVAEFNRKVITAPFNEAVCGELVKHINPFGPDKTLIFCVTDEHADLVVDRLKKVMAQHYPDEIGDDHIRKITGQSDKPLQQIRNFRNERLPAIAVTVDLLTTGIDVPAICNLVFLRKVNSRILFEQMLGRATRRCESINKEEFRVFDAVGTYSDMLQNTNMRPVVVNPNISFNQLSEEFREQQGEQAQALIRDQFLAKFQRKARHLDDRQQALLQEGVGMTPQEFGKFLKETPLVKIAQCFCDNPWLGELLDAKSGKPRDAIPISQQPDRIVDVAPYFGAADDYLDRFASYLKEHGNEIPALVAVLQRPRDLTRADLKKLAVTLQIAGFDERSLGTAWAHRSNESIAAGILGFIRQAALGDPLVPFEHRVDQALNRIRQRHPEFSSLQKQWLDKLGKQLKRNVVLDRDVLDTGPLAEEGGFGRIDRFFDGHLQELLAELNEAVWAQQA
ncbi:type I restriction-modification system endonuclease [Pseudomonas sp. MH9.3]|uniref:type I restriction-modification system endonuclease n=1 Tax=Pseudomonas sp. MH9.3 TaxID=3048630 RepID=UPI002AC8A20E|nr:type I restriction-modification system endonuclease [Pseudomonas sp. MH9.3]MEB0106041.1 type I restriction-modification system endonuclease [Pseudomonas sp. MH9.3]WPX78013.1 type I restriction-modification system endonuclease [Pseudomonas sp. MH9.3]WQG59339.1 type I restriction-modification system endonuclease [Pseudomonas sp. RTB3]